MDRIPCEAGSGDANIYVEMSRGGGVRKPVQPAAFWLCEKHASNCCGTKNITCKQADVEGRDCPDQPEEEEDEQWKAKLRSKPSADEDEWLPPFRS